MKKISILGAGAWGCAVGQHFARCGYQVIIWCFEDYLAAQINEQHTNDRYLPGLAFEGSLSATSSLAEALQFSTLIAEAVPVAHLRGVLGQAKPFITKEHQWLVLSKGIENESMLLPSQIIASVLGFVPITAVLAGPTFARDIMTKELSAAALACGDDLLRSQLVQDGSNSYFKLIPTDDIIGVQLASAVKNVIALAVGIARGAQCKDNTAAYLVTAGLQELGELAVYWGGKKETIYTVAGVGDLVLTCTGALSKNLHAGKLFGEGKTLDEVRYTVTTLPEGVNTVKSLYELMQREGLDLPVTAAVHDFIFQHHKLERFFQALF